jgi:4a-hydroxytetrahydrobiopterin dehydratase
MLPRKVRSTMAAQGSDAGGLTPARFHTHPGVQDWRVTATGPQAVFRAQSFAQAAKLVPAIVAEADRLRVEPDVDLRPEAVIVRVPPRDLDSIPASAPEFAAAVSTAARELGLHPDISRIQSVDISVAQHPDVDTRPFWTAALGYDIIGDTDSIDPLRRGPQLSFQPIDGEREGRGRTHIDVFVPADQAEARVAGALAHGGRLVDDSRAPAWWTIASPENHGIDIAAWTDTYD